MSYFKIKSHAKINLARNVVGKSKLLHKIESVIKDNSKNFFLLNK